MQTCLSLLIIFEIKSVNVFGNDFISGKVKLTCSGGLGSV